MSNRSGYVEKRREREKQNRSRVNIERVLYEDGRVRRIKVWVKDVEPKQGANYFIVEFRSVKPIKGKDLEVILIERLSDLFEE